MANDWPQTTVGQVAARTRNALVGGPFGSNLVSRDYVERGVPVIRGQNMAERWVSGDFVYVTPQKAESLAGNLARPGDILFTQRGTLGQVSLVPPQPFDPYLISQSQMKLTVNRDIAEPLFFYYVFRTPEQQNYVRQHAIQTGVPHTNLGILRGTPVRLPPLAEQRAIAEVLGALDDKIELNRHMNETLEAIARATFKSWFVDFDPMRAKAEGRQPYGMDDETAALFPDTFEDSPLGKVPEGWTIARMGDVVDITKGRSYASSELADSDAALVTLKSFRRGGGYRRDGLKPFIGQHKPDQVVLPGELVVAYTDVTQSADVIGKPAIVRSEARYSTLVASLDVGIIRPKSAAVSRAFLYCLFRTDDFQAHTYGHATGTTVLHLSKEAIPSFPFVCPTTAIGQAFASIAEPLFTKIDQNEQEASVLAELRDTLLPKLLSGEVRTSTEVQP